MNIIIIYNAISIFLEINKAALVNKYPLNKKS